jgi:hypothetical protein
MRSQLDRWHHGTDRRLDSSGKRRMRLRRGESV